jgi:hypothetical protein
MPVSAHREGSPVPVVKGGVFDFYLCKLTIGASAQLPNSAGLSSENVYRNLLSLPAQKSRRKIAKLRHYFDSHFDA